MSERPLERRRFNSSERVALYLAADGRCSMCGVELGAGWHADHVAPYSVGGKTDVINGQALCPKCNLRKGGKMGRQWHTPTGFEPRKWQVDAQVKIDEAITSGDPYALIDVSPGGGKTIFALWVATLMRQRGLIDKLFIVVPSLDLKVQWRDAAHEFGIDLTTSRLVPADDEDGAVMTYQAISDLTVPLLRKLTKGALVIGDEIHRAGARCADVVWGERFEVAFERSRLPLLMSGTPVRPPGKGALPYVLYEGKPRVATTAYAHGYAKCLADECVRELIFPSSDGDVEWFDWSVWDRLKMSFADEASEEIAARRYKNALTPKGKLLPGLLKRADDRLSDIRRYEHADAGALALCIDQNHAERVAAVLKEITGETASLVISDNENAADELKAFRRGSGRWLVAVNKISEGVDIPRLRVEVYATDIRSSEAAFRQRALRVGRYMPTSVLPKEKNRRGYVYILADPVLLSYAMSIREDRLHALQIKEERAEDTENGTSERLPLELGEDPDMKVFTSDPKDSVTVTSEWVFEAEEMSYAELLRHTKPHLARFSPEDIMEILKANSEAIVADEGGSSEPPAVGNLGDPLEDRKQSKRKTIGRLVGAAVKKHGLEYSHVNSELNERFIRANRDAFTETDLDQAIEYMNEQYRVW